MLEVLALARKVNRCSDSFRRHGGCLSLSVGSEERAKAEGGVLPHPGAGGHARPAPPDPIAQAAAAGLVTSRLGSTPPPTVPARDGACGDEAHNALVTLLGLRVPMGGSDDVSDGSPPPRFPP
ncbi:hypothetical protein EVAR_52072_1 [Eumeta japonica]|uniref:Uncharacterized protein n=1 Tax=Eumeta variegata TaxID=151549 RepID=A0A4C1Y5A5_EUMVA|nr:hypothetical protein EVAR_52072_1 [Eumeta japonica]